MTSVFKRERTADGLVYDLRPNPEYPNNNELGDRAWAAMLAENNTYAEGRKQAIWWRCADAGLVES